MSDLFNKVDKNPPAFQFYASDFLTETSSLTNEEVGVYMRLIATQWVQESLPSDIPKLCMIARINTKNFNKIWSNIDYMFSAGSDGRFRNIALDNVRREYQKLRAERSRCGTNGAEKRWQKNGKAIATAMETDTQDDSSSSSSSNVNNKSEPGEGIIPIDWRPAEEVVMAISKEIPFRFIEAMVPQFIVYWRERGKHRENWGINFINHVRVNWSNLSVKNQAEHCSLDQLDERFNCMGNHRVS